MVAGATLEETLRPIAAHDHFEAYQAHILAAGALRSVGQALARYQRNASAKLDRDESLVRERSGCPDGQQLAVESCYEADCSVVRVDLPPRNGFEVRFFEKRDVLIKRVASCTQRSLVVRNGALALVP